MDRVFNIPTSVMQGHTTKQERIAIAAWLGIKFAYGNSTKYGISRQDIKQFYHCGEKYAKDILNAFKSNSALFYNNKRKDCIFAKSAKSKEVKIAKDKKHTKYRSDMVIAVKVPSCYTDGSNTTLSLRELLSLIDFYLVASVRCSNARNKLLVGSQKCESKGICETETKVSQAYAAKVLGYERTRIGRIEAKMVKMGYARKEALQPKICQEGEQYSYPTISKQYNERYWVKNEPMDISLVLDGSLKVKHIIWTHKKRVCSTMFSQRKIERLATGELSLKERYELWAQMNEH